MFRALSFTILSSLLGTQDSPPKLTLLRDEALWYPKKFQKRVVPTKKNKVKIKPKSHANKTVYNLKHCLNKGSEGTKLIIAQENVLQPRCHLRKGPFPHSHFPYFRQGGTMPRDDHQGALVSSSYYFQSWPQIFSLIIVLVVVYKKKRTSRHIFLQVLQGAILNCWELFNLWGLSSIWQGENCRG